MKYIVELKIYNKQDRLDVAGILLKNGYTVSQVKKSRNSSGKTVDYYLKVSEDEENADTSKNTGK
ncbi:MAG: hypothetical protein ACFNTU_00350 [Catonella sp.]